MFIGLNGSGKTAILDAIALHLKDYHDMKSVVLDNIYIKKLNIEYDKDDIKDGELNIIGKLIFNYYDNENSFSKVLFNKNDGAKKKKSGKVKIHDLTEEQRKNFICLYYKTNRSKIYIIDSFGGWETDFNTFDNFLGIVKSE